MKIFKIILIIIVVVILGLGALIFINMRPISKEDAIEEIQKIIEKDVKKNENITSALIKIDSGELNFNESFVVGETNGKPTQLNQAFHVASVGKAFTATLIGMLVEEDKLNLDDYIAEYLSEEVLTGLYTVDGIDYSKEATIRQVLNHTSGVADYFDDPVSEGETIIKLVLSDADHLWTPTELIDFTRTRQEAIAKPGETYHYSDTGYILLGLIIEKVSEKSFDVNLHEKIFEPLEMNDSYLMFYSEPKNEKQEINEIWFFGEEISDYNSVSIDWAGGGIVSTLDDLDKFVKALNSYKLVSEELLYEMYTFDYKFNQGIYYGLGMMEYRFTDFAPTLKMLPNLRGHMGVLGTQMLYDKQSDTSIIMCYGSTDFTECSIRSLIKIMLILNRIE